MKFTIHNSPQSTVGTPPALGETFPDFSVLDENNRPTHLLDLIGQPTVISVVPDINTRVCDLQTKRFNETVSQFDHINFYTISTNSVAEQKKWCAAKDVAAMKLLSDASFDFGRATGLLYAEGQIDARSVWVLSATGEVVYRQLVAEMTDEPDYQAVISFLETHY